MKDFTENIRMQEFLQWIQDQKSRTHETDPQVQDNSRKNNVAPISTEAAAVRSITKAKA